MSTIQNKKQNYQILSLIGQGAYGQVYKARKKFTGQFVAIKSIKKKGKQQKDIKAMRQQIQILRKLKHQNIILLLDSFQSPSQFILVTQLGQGQLFNIIQDDQSLQIQQIRKIAQQLVRALYYIHSNRITHRDMKPQNILMTSDGVIKLCDFGFARSMSYKTQVLTSLKGTPLYMAPEVVKEEPYNHTADLWSLGVILYELATGNPPFTAPNLITLVDHISKDPIVYPEIINGDFKNFLKGLLNKDPKKRLGWPELLHHPFIKQTQIQKNQRKRKTEKFTNWIEDNIIAKQQANVKSNQTMDSKYIIGTGQNKNQKNISPLKQQSVSNHLNSQNSDPLFQKYYIKSLQQKGCQQLRSDSSFMQTIIKITQIQTNQLIRVKQRRQSLHLSIKTLTQVLLSSKFPVGNKLDVGKNMTIVFNVLNVFKSLLKIQYGKQYVEIISDMVKLIGLLARVTYQKEFGIQIVYIKTFIPLFQIILKSIYQGENNQMNQNYVINFLKTVGMFVNHASYNHIRSFSFYKDIFEGNFIQESIQITKKFYNNMNVLKVYVQVLSALIHPVFGDIQPFPWRRSTQSHCISQFKQFSTMSECIRLSIINILLQHNYVQIFQQILSLEQQSATLPKISISRIILNSLRLSKDFNQSFLSYGKNIIKYFYQNFDKDYVFYTMSCEIVGQMFKYLKEQKKENLLEKDIGFVIDSVLKCLKSFMGLNEKQIGKINGWYLSVYGSLGLIYEMLSMDSNQNKIINFFNNEKLFALIGLYISDSTNSKLQQMRKIQGSNYGIHSFGFYDFVFLILHKLYMRISKTVNTPFIQQFATNLMKSRLPEKISNLIKNCSQNTDISPRGMVSCLIFINDMINLNINEQFIDERFIHSLVKFLQPDQIDSILDWPQSFGGGQSCITIIFGNLNIIILNLLKVSQKYPLIPKTISQSKLIIYIIDFAKYLTHQNISSIMSILSHLLILDNSDKSSSNYQSFAHQFIRWGGMSLFNRFNLLDKDKHQTSALIDSCNFLSLLARQSKEYYEHIESICPFKEIKELLKSQDAQLKAKVLNLVGNLCRHSGGFYRQLVEFEILQKCIKLCEDQDKAVKRFACVAIGNASFYDSTLYEHLRPAIPILINLFKDSDEKTRSNAVAAIGNLARNSSILDKDFVKNGVNYQLINLFVNEKSISCKKVCVMGLNNLLSLPQSRAILENQNIQNLFKKYTPPNYNQDVGLIKACTKALQKLQVKLQTN